MRQHNTANHSAHSSDSDSEFDSGSDTGQPNATHLLNPVVSRAHPLTDVVVDRQNPNGAHQIQGTAQLGADDNHSSNSVPPFALQKRVHGPASVKQDFFRKTGGMFVWISLFLQLIVSVGIIVAITLITEKKLISGAYSLFIPRPRPNVSFFMEIARFLFLLAIGSSIQSLFLIFATIIPYIIVVATLKDDEVGRRKQRSVEHFLALRWHIGAALFSIAVAVAAQFLYPLPPLPTKPNDAPKDINVPLLKEYLLALVLVKNSPEFMLTRLLISIAVFMVLLFLQKLFLQRLVIYYHTSTLYERIDANYFALKIVRRLKRHFRAELGKSVDHKLSTGELLYQGLCPPDKDKITCTDFYHFMSQEEATRLFAILDAESSGDLTKSEFLQAIDNLYMERDALDAAVDDQVHIFDRLDVVFTVISVIVGILVGLAVLEVSLEIIFSTIGATIGALLFIFGSSLEDAFRSIVFVIFSHPFDVADRVIINKTTYKVVEVGLWSSTFIGPEGRLIYMSNISLVGSSIVNLRRSPPQGELINISISPTTSMKKIEALEDELTQFVKNNPRDYFPTVTVKNFTIVDNKHMTIDIAISHRGNFQDGFIKDIRTKSFTLFLREAIDKCKIEMAPPYW